VRLPDFVIIGAQKSGTTWLARGLAQHPQVFMPSSELHYFDKAWNHSRGLEWYARHFEGASQDQVVGEKSPDYLWVGGQGAEGHLPDVHRNLHRELPDAKLIVMLRDPVARAVSAAKHVIRTGRVSPREDLDDLLVGSRRHLLESHGVFSYGRYAHHLEAYFELFPREQIRILVFEEVMSDTRMESVRDVCRFIGVDPGFPFVEPGRVNGYRASRVALYANYYLPKLRPIVRRLERRLPPGRNPHVSDKTMALLRQSYAEDNERLYDLLGRRITAWDSEGIPASVAAG
jgi:hypothetical protein